MTPLNADKTALNTNCMVPVSTETFSRDLISEIVVTYASISTLTLPFYPLEIIYQRLIFGV
jgi:hypothetical protein